MNLDKFQFLYGAIKRKLVHVVGPVDEEFQFLYGAIRSTAA